MKIKLLIINLLFLCTINIYAQKQTLVYDLKVSGKSIGKVTTTKSVDNNKIIYSSNTDATVKLLFTIDIKTRMKVIFEDGKLIESDYKFYKNNKLKETATITLKGNKYILVHDDKVSKINTIIKASTIILPFYKPTDNEKIFEEVEGDFKIMKLLNEGSYNLINTKSNHKDDYIYQNGSMQSCLIRNTFINFEMTLIEE